MEKLEQIEKLALLSGKNVFTMQDMTAVTGLSIYVLREKCRKKEIPYYRGADGGKLLYFKRSEVEAWMLQNRVNTTQEAEQEAINYVVTNQGKGHK